MLRSLRYFEVVARLGSVKAAAVEVGVSASAISHQLNELTTFLGEELVVRSGRGIRLSDSGRRLYHHVSPMFSNLEEVFESVIGRKKSFIRLGVCSSFGPFWLAGRLPDFKREFPDIDLELHLFSQYPLQSEMTADVVVTADPLSAGFDSTPLFAEKLVSIVSPNAEFNRDGMPKQLITTDIGHKTRGQDWLDYSKLTKCDFIASSADNVLPCTHYVLALAMARADLGAALVPDFVAAEAIAAGDVVILDPMSISSGRLYKLCYKASRARDPDLRSLARWFKSQLNENTLPTRNSASE